MKFGRWMALLAALMVSFAVRAHGSWQEHVADMTEVMGLREEPRLRAWTKFISSDMIDKCEPFYSELKARYEGFACKHRLLFHWGYDAEPWSPEREARVVRYCREYDLDRDSTLRLFRSEMVAEQKRRNALLNRRTEELFGFAHGGRDAASARFFASVAYNVHLVGDYTSDNRDLAGLQSLDRVVRSLCHALQDLDPVAAKPLVKALERVGREEPDLQKRADALLALLKQQLPDFIRRAQGGAIRRRLEARGFAFR